MDLGIAGRTALVVGGGRGIGRAVAIALAKEGARVTVMARTASEVEAVAREIGGKALVADVRQFDPQGIDAPQILVLCAAALYQPKKLQFIDDAEQEKFLAADFAANATLCRRLLPGMMEARFGRIVAISSLAARTGTSGGTLYAATKSALEGLMRGIALDYSRRGITANAVAVGFADTERLQLRLKDDPASREHLEKATAMRRLLTPAEVADVVAFLCSTRASAITGSVVDATGGAHLNNLW
jgi:NAD(P)-dependent dehydrogenase (short-subunit alcohol dehydrogenase family)